MEINQVLVRPHTDYASRLIPVSEIALMRMRPPRFRFEECRVYLAGEGLDINHFYFNRYHPFAWFVYYHDFVLIELPAFNKSTFQAFHLTELIKLSLSRLQTCLAAGDFLNYFNLVDQRVALPAFLSHFDAIPDREKHHLFWYIFSRCSFRLQDFRPEFIACINDYRSKPLHIRSTDNRGYIRVYRGQPFSEPPPAQGTSWTLDVNTAIIFATERPGTGKVYSGYIHKDKVVAHIKYRNEREILAFPGQVENICELDLPAFKDLEPELKANGVLDLFASYNQRLQDIYFHRPHGIHGLSHTRRVLLLSLILAQEEKLDEADRDLLGQAALFHDIGRSNDNFDPRHGQVSYQKLQLLNLSPYQDEEKNETLRFIIENHCITDSEAHKQLSRYQLPHPDKAFALYQVFKDADGLDRVRINDLDTAQLRSASARRLLLAARELFNTILP